MNKILAIIMFLISVFCCGYIKDGTFMLFMTFMSIAMFFQKEDAEND